MPGSKDIYRIPDAELENYRQFVECACEEVSAYTAPLKKGQKVRVFGGNMQGIEAYVQRVKGKRAVIGCEIKYIAGHHRDRPRTPPDHRGLNPLSPKQDRFICLQRCPSCPRCPSSYPTILPQDRFICLPTVVQVVSLCPSCFSTFPQDRFICLTKLFKLFPFVQVFFQLLQKTSV